MWPFGRRAEPVEKRAHASGFTAEVMAARESYTAGRRGIGELTATTQACISLWENGLSLADVFGTDLLTRRVLALTGRSLALRGEAVFLIGESELVPCSDWDLRTRYGRPSAYRIGVSEAGGGQSMTVLAGEVLHVVTGADPAAPWIGTAPLRRASLTAAMLQAIETALCEVFENAPLGSQIVPMPEMPETDMEAMARGFRGNRGRVLIRESVNVSAAGGPAPMADWRAADVSPDLSRSMTAQSLAAAREAVQFAFGVLPGWSNPLSTGPLIREAQRHLAQWQLQPLAVMIGEEATAKLGVDVSLDCMRPLQAFDAGGRARALQGILAALAAAKEAGVDPAAALHQVDWAKGDELT